MHQTHAKRVRVVGSGADRGRVGVRTVAWVLAGVGLALGVGGVGGCAGKPGQAGSGGGAGQAAAEGRGDGAGSSVVSTFAVDHDAWAKVGYRLDWVSRPFPRGGARPRLVFSEVRGDALTLQDASGTVTLVEASTGATRWATDVAGPLTRFVGLMRDPASETRVLVFSETEMFTLEAASGNLSGRDDLDKVVNTLPVVDGDVVMFGTSTGQVYAHRRSTQLGAWGFGMEGTVEADPVRLGQGAAFVNQSGEVAVLNASGNLLGRGRIFGGVSTNPVSDGERVYIAGMDQSLWAFTESGALAWRYRTPVALTVQPTVHEGVVYCEIPGSGLTAFDAAGGTVAWVAKGVTGRVVGVRSGRLVVWSGEGRGGGELLLLDRRDGSVVERLTVPEAREILVGEFVDGPVYVVTERGALAKFITR